MITLTTRMNVVRDTWRARKHPAVAADTHTQGRYPIRSRLSCRTSPHSTLIMVSKSDWSEQHPTLWSSPDVYIHTVAPLSQGPVRIRRPKGANPMAMAIATGPQGYQPLEDPGRRLTANSELGAYILYPLRSNFGTNRRA